MNLTVICAVFFFGANRVFAKDKQADESIFKKDIISEVNIELDEDEFQDMLDHPLEEEYKEGTVTYNGETIDYTGVRLKGNSSLRTVAESDSNRYSFKLKFNKYIDQDLAGYTKINLNNNFADPSYMREYLTYQLLDRMGLETPNYSFVNLSINGEPYGLYLAIENIEEAYLERYFGDSIGNLYKADSGASLNWTEGMTIEETDLVLKLGSETDTQLLEFIEALNNGENIEDYFDVDKYLRYLAVSTVTANMDSYQGNFNHNYYLYEQDGRFTFLAWDHNMSIGGMTGNNEDEQIEMLIDEPTVGNIDNYPLVEYVLSNEAYTEQYHQYVQETVNLLKDFDAQVDEIEALIGEAVKEDPTAFYTYDEFLANIGDQSVDGVPGIVGFINQRISHVQKQLDGEIASYENGEGISGGMAQGDQPGEMPERGKEDSPEDVPVMGGGAPEGMPEMGEGAGPEGMSEMEKPDDAEENSELNMPDKPGGIPELAREGMQANKEVNQQGQLKGLLEMIVLLVILVGAILFINRYKRYQGYNKPKHSKSELKDSSLH